MAKYSPERKEAVLKQMLPPHNLSLTQLMKQERIPYQTLYNWRLKAKKQGDTIVPNKSASKWSPEAKLAVIIETATLTQTEFGQYCRERGLYQEQIDQWKVDSLSGFNQGTEQRKAVAKEQAVSRLQIKELQRELRRKDSALAEASALLILEKKLKVLWGDDSEVK